MSTKITVALDWTPNGNHLGFFVAKDKGLYDAAGLDVTIGESRGFALIPTIAEDIPA